MNTSIILTIIVLLCHNVKGGGYTSKGGVVQFYRELDYINEARKAAIFARSLQHSNGRHRAPQKYFPTFYTTSKNYDAFVDTRKKMSQRISSTLPPPGVIYYKYFNKTL